MRSLHRISLCLLCISVFCRTTPSRADVTFLPEGQPYTQSQKDWLDVRAKGRQYANELAENDIKGAVQLAEKMLVYDRQAFGNVHREVADGLDFIAALYYRQEEFSSAVSAKQEIVEITAKLLGENHWRVRQQRYFAEVYAILGKAAPEVRRIDTQADALQAKANRLLDEQPDESLKVSVAAGELYEKIFGNRSPHYAEALKYQAVANWKLGDLAKAELLFEQAAELYASAYGKESAAYGNIQYNLGNVYLARRDYARSENAYRAALEIEEKEHHGQGRLFVSALQGLASVYSAIGQLSRAEEHSQKALDLVVAAEGKQTQNYFDAVARVASIAHARGNFVEAEKLCREALDGIKRTVGQKSRQYIDTLNILAGIVSSRPDGADEVLKLSREGKEIASSLPDQQMAFTKAFLKHESFAYLQRQEFAAAEKSALQALEMEVASSGERSAGSLAVVDQLLEIADKWVRAYAAADRFDEAAKVFERTMALATTHYGADDWHTAKIKLRSAWLVKYRSFNAEQRRQSDESEKALGLVSELLKQEKVADAVNLAESVLKSREELFGRNDELAAECCLQLGWAQQVLENYGAAEPLLRRAADICREIYVGKEPPPLFAQVLFFLANLRQQQGEYSDAVQLLIQARENAKSRAASEVQSMAAVELALAYIEAGEVEAAQALLLENLALQERMGGKQSLEYARTLHGLAMLYARTNSTGVGVTNFNRAEQILRANPAGEEALLSLYIDWNTYLAERGEHQNPIRSFESCRQALMTSSDSPERQRLRLRTLHGLGMAYLNAKEFDKAHRAARDAYDLQRKRFPGVTKAAQPEALLLGRCVQAQFDDALLADRLDDAIAVLDKGVDLFTDLFGSENWRVHDARNRREILLRVVKLGNEERKKFAAAIAEKPRLRKLVTLSTTPETLKSLDDMLTALESLTGTDNVFYQESLQLSIEALIVLHQNAEAARRSATLVDSAAKCQGPQSPLVGYAHSWLGRLEWQQDHRPLAREHFAASASAMQAAFGESAREYGTQLTVLAESQLAPGGDLVAAQRAIEKAREILSRSQSQDSPAYALCLQIYGQVCTQLGDTDQAELQYRRGYEFGARSFVYPSMLRAQAAQALASHYTRQRQFKDAGPLLRDALEQTRKLYGERSEWYAANLEALANLMRDEGDMLLPGPMYQQAIEIRTALNGGESLPVANLFLECARMHLSRGDFAFAARDLNQSSAIIHKVVGPTAVMEGCQICEADLAFQQGDVKRAQQIRNRVLEAIEASSGHVGSAQAEAQQFGLAQRLYTQLSDYLSLGSEKETAEQAYAHVLAWKGFAFSRQKNLRSAMHDENAKALFRKWERLTGRLATLALHAPYAEDRDPWLAQVRVANSERDQVESELVLATEAAPSVPTTPASISASLSPGMALVDFVEFLKRVPSKKQGSWDIETHMIAFVIRSNNQYSSIDLGPSKPIAEEVDAWLQANERRDDVTELARLGRPIRDRIWKPLQENIKDANLILVSPAGALTRFPLAALPGVDADTFLVEERSIVMLPVPALLPHLLHAAKWTDDGSLVAFGDVAYAGSAGGNDVREIASRKADGGRSSLLSGAFKALPNSGPEVDEVKDRFMSCFVGAPVELLKGDQATEGAFRQLAPKARWLHLATHGFYAPEMIESALAKTRDESASPISKELRLGVKFHPGLLSGMGMAGANIPNRPDEDDGILSAIEVAALDLTNVDLAVLSACETARGQEGGGEGVLGLQRAFEVAGARSVVATLWPVNDAATRRLMLRFYFNLWEKKLPKHEALREAQKWMLAGARVAARTGDTGTEIALDSDKLPAKLLHPSIWAPFVLSGDWR